MTSDSELKSTAKLTVLDRLERRFADETGARSADMVLERAVDNVPGLFYMKDADGRYRFVNKVFKEWCGLDEEKIIGRTVHDLPIGDEANGYHDHDREIIESDNSSEQEIQTNFPDGIPRSLRVIKYPIKDERGRSIGIGGIATYITERKRAEEALRESEERVRPEFHEAATSKLMGDANGKLHLVNPSTIHDRGGGVTHYFSFQNDVASQDMAHVREHASRLYEKLTPRERQVFKLIVNGVSNKEIAQHFDLSVRTVEKHRLSVMAKMESDNVPLLVHYGIALSTPFLK